MEKEDHFDSQDDLARIAEQWEVYEYVHERPLSRPQTNLLNALRFFLSTSILPALAAALLVLLLCIRVDFLPDWLENAVWNHGFLFWLLLYGLFFLISCLFQARRVLSGLVRLYQHYAPEKIRRRCLCKPTCSEYALLVLEQERNVLKALWKIYIRLHKTCKGGIYKIDMP